MRIADLTTLSARRGVFVVAIFQCKTLLQTPHTPAQILYIYQR
jgi:hypothetical protein